MISVSRNFDVVIMGGGLAGGSLGLQLIKDNPSLRIAVLSKQIHPLKDGFGSVGESTVEIASHYLSEKLGLKQHLELEQLPKLGLRYFLEANNKNNIQDRLEVGGNRYAPTPTYQVDRAKLENKILENFILAGGNLIHNANIKDVRFGSKRKEVSYYKEGLMDTISAGWLVDASGRTGILRKKFNLQSKLDHKCSASWWRLKGEHRIDSWCSDPAWSTNNTGEFARWFSTNHLMGRGYWVWIIPLSSSATSFGVVFDSTIHSYNQLNTYDKTLYWLESNEPQLAKLCLEHSSSFQDFGTLKNFSYTSSTVFSGDSWALTGEAGAFIDPLYSPGSDFIAISNSYVADLILRSFKGENIKLRADIYNSLFLRFVSSTLNTFKDQYKLIGNPKVLPIKVFWDWCFYWNFLARLYFEEKLCDLKFLQEKRQVFKEVEELGIEMQRLFSLWSENSRPLAKPGFLDLARHPYLFDLNRSLLEKNELQTSEEKFIKGINDLKDISIEIKTIIANDLPNIVKRKEFENSVLSPRASLFYEDLKEFLIPL